MDAISTWLTLADHHPAAVILLAGVALVDAAAAADEQGLRVARAPIAILVAEIIADLEIAIRAGAVVAPGIVRVRTAALEGVEIGAIEGESVPAIESAAEIGGHRLAEDHARNSRIPPSARGCVAKETAQDHAGQLIADIGVGAAFAVERIIREYIVMRVASAPCLLGAVILARDLEPVGIVAVTAVEAPHEFGTAEIAAEDAPFVLEAALIAACIFEAAEIEPATVAAEIAPVVVAALLQALT
jgi:hypothetical protein